MSRMVARAAALALCWAEVVLAAPRPLKVAPSEQSAARQITARLFSAHVRFLASDLLEGRGPATTGDLLTQEYLISQFEALGLEPAAPGGGWRQPFELVGVRGHPDALEIMPFDNARAEQASGRGDGSALELRYGADFIAVSGHQRAQSKVDGELVFAGYGIVAPEFQWDDYRGVDVRGKVLLLLNNDPEDDPRLFGGRTRLWYGRWDYKYLQAAKLGAAGAIIIHTSGSAGYPWQVVQTSWSGEQFELPATSGPTLEMKGWTSEEATRRLLTLAGRSLEELQQQAKSREFRPVPLGLRVSTTFQNEVVRGKQTANVLARLPGSNPKLRGELVIYTAHHDHLGKKAGGQPGEDAIYNGAVDNASGVAAMLAVARAFASLPKPPGRSILFAAVAAEEQGLLGSAYLAQHPPVSPSKMAANINIDGVNIWGRTRDVTVIGLGKSDLDAHIQALAEWQRRVVKPDQLPDRGFFYRSDQFNFAKLGVPAAYFGSGMDFIGRPPGWGKERREAWEDQDYHQPSDELSAEWDFSGAVEDAKLYFLLGVRVANHPRLPGWKKGDEFEQVRLRSLGAQP